MEDTHKCIQLAPISHRIIVLLHTRNARWRRERGRRGVRRVQQTVLHKPGRMKRIRSAEPRKTRDKSRVKERERERRRVFTQLLDNFHWTRVAEWPDWRRHHLIEPVGGGACLCHYRRNHCYELMAVVKAFRVLGARRRGTMLVMVGY